MAISVISYQLSLVGLRWDDTYCARALAIAPAGASGDYLFWLSYASETDRQEHRHWRIIKPDRGLTP